LAAVAELRRHFPGIEDNAQARLCVRTIAGWQPQPDAAETKATVRDKPART
jgi:hypothetical protein